MQLLQLIVLGAIAGFTIFLGLPIARMRSVSPKLKGMLNSAAAGILVFLLIDVLGNAFTVTREKILSALAGTVGVQEAILFSLILVAGVAIGLLGLVWFEGRFIRSPASPASKKASALSEHTARRIATMIAIGIGLHNFSEGLAIGQSYASGALPLALLLVIGFGLHNATEGFGIAAPLSGSRPDWSFLIVLGLIGGGPTFLGAIVGGFWVSQALSVFFFSLAAGAILYVVKELLFHGRIAGESLATMSFLILGLLIGFATDLLITYASGG